MIGSLEAMKLRDDSRFFSGIAAIEEIRLRDDGFCSDAVLITSGGDENMTLLFAFEVALALTG